MTGLLKTHSLFFNAIQRILDIVIILAVTYSLGKYFDNMVLFRGIGIFGIILTIILFSVFDIYKSWREFGLLPLLWRVCTAWFVVLVTINIIILIISNPAQLAGLWPFALMKTKEFISWGGGILILMIFLRLISRTTLKMLRKRGYNQRSVAIVGTNATARKLAHYIVSNPWMGLRIIGFFDMDKPLGEEIFEKGLSLGNVIGDLNDITEDPGKYAVDSIFVSLRMRMEREIQKIIWELGTKGISVFLHPDLFTIGIQRASMFSIGGIQFFDMNLFPPWKRVFDIIFSSLIIVLTSPIWLLIAIIIKLQDGGPILFKHQRIMETGRKFGCFKFRTMRPDADKRLKQLLEQNPDMKEEWEKTFKLKNDPRITPIGKFLRKSSLDELPQFLNVFIGHMSVVGARPIVDDELCYYYKDIALIYCSMKPGITGLWQVGKRSDIKNYADRVELDQQYILQWSFWTDMRIILKTILRLILPRGAY